MLSAPKPVPSDFPQGIGRLKQLLDPREDALGPQRSHQVIVDFRQDRLDKDCSYLEIVDAINTYGAKPAHDRAELFRRISDQHPYIECDHHFCNHGFLWAGRRGWQLSPAYDLNPNPSSIRVLSTRIDFEDGTASIDLLRSVAEYFVTMVDADTVISECRAVTSLWRDFPHTRGAPSSEVRMMETAFAHEHTR